MLQEESIKKLSHKIESEINSVPAGGSTAAVTGLLGVSLLKLCLQISQKEWSKKEEIKLKDTIRNLNVTKDELLIALDKDVEVYKLNKTSNFNNQEDLKKLIEVPFSIAYQSFIALRIADKFKNKIKKTVIADHKTAVYNLKASIDSALTITETNYSFFSSKEKYLCKIKKKVIQLKKRLDNLIIN